MQISVNGHDDEITAKDVDAMSPAFYALVRPDELGVEMRGEDVDRFLESLWALTEVPQKLAPRVVGRHDLQIKVHEGIVEEVR